jgi:Lipocalin-like domain
MISDRAMSCANSFEICPRFSPDADGRFHFITVRTDAPKLASSDPSRPTPEEAMAIASGSIAYTGTYTVDENTKTIHANVDTSTFPNLVWSP